MNVAMQALRRRLHAEPWSAAASTAAALAAAQGASSGSAPAAAACRGAAALCSFALAALRGGPVRQRQPPLQQALLSEVSDVRRHSLSTAEFHRGIANCP